MKKVYIILSVVIFLNSCLSDSDPVVPPFNVNVNVILLEEGTNLPVKNAVVWLTTVNEDPFTDGFEGVALTDSTGQCVIHFSAEGDSVDYYDFINISKSGYEFLDETVRINDHEIDVSYNISPSGNVDLAPYFIRLKEDSTNIILNLKYYSIYFSELVIFNDLNGIRSYFDRMEDICLGGNATITNDSCNYDISGKYYIVFSHRAVDSANCPTSTDPVTYTLKTAKWEVTDVKLQDILCEDMAGNRLVPKNIYP